MRFIHVKLDNRWLNFTDNEVTAILFVELTSTLTRLPINGIYYSNMYYTLQ